MSQVGFCTSRSSIAGMTSLFSHTSIEIWVVLVLASSMTQPVIETDGAFSTSVLARGGGEASSTQRPHNKAPGYCRSTLIFNRFVAGMSGNDRMYGKAGLHSSLARRPVSPNL